MQFYARNQQTNKTFLVTEKDYTLTMPKLTSGMEARTLELTLGRNVPVQQFAEVIAVERGIPIFRGYVESYEIDSKKEKTLSVIGAEGWLNRRSCISYFYPEDTEFSALLADSLTTLGQPGLLAVANSAVPPGLDYTVYASADNQIKIAGGGKASRFGTRDMFSVDYRYIRKIDEVSALADLAGLDNVLYRDDDDLYIKLNNHHQRGWPDLGGLLVENAFDTSVRIGYYVAKSLSGSLQVNVDDKIGDVIVDTAMGHGYHVHVRDDWNFTYLDFIETEGRATGYVFYEKDLTDIQKSIPDDAKVHSLTGVGVGNQYYTCADLSYTGFWNQGVYEVEHGFKDFNGILMSRTDEKYGSMQTDWQWKIRMQNKDVLLLPGDFVTLAPNHEPQETLSCQIIEYSANELTLELGARRRTNADTWELLQGLDRGFTDTYLLELHQPITQTTTFYPSDPAHAAPSGSLAFAVPVGVLDASKRPRITLSLTMKAQSSAVDISFGRVAIVVSVGTNAIRVGQLVGTTIGEPLPEIDITDVVTANATNTVYINVYMVNEYSQSHTAYTSHPQISVSGTMNFYKRGAMA
jgi:hypothetical protein